MDKLLALQASAGSGKTYALSVRYLSLLFLGANPSGIVALTFTKKAANEMQERIFSTLKELENKSELNDICELTNKSKDEILSSRPKIAQRFLNSNLHIQTIDAFFAKILRKFSLHLGIMPDFTPTDVSFDGKLEELFIKTLMRNKKDFNSMMDFMIYERKSVDNIFNYFISLYEKSKELTFDISSNKSYPNDDKILSKAKEISLYLSDKNAPQRTINTFMANNLDELLAKSFWKLEALNNRTYAKYQSDGLDKLYKELQSLYCEYCKQKQEYILGQIFKLFKLYERVKFDLILQTNELSFSDISFLTHELLRHSISNDFFYFRLDSQIEHLLIDEFQDTNIVQFDILEPIITEIASGTGTKEDKSFFYVGDTKQSIYRFRGGSKELFNAVAKRFNVKIDPLKTNYRSKGNLVTFVNETFAKQYADFEPQKVKEQNQNQGFIEVLTDDNLLEKTYEYITFLLKSNINLDEIAILCHTNTDAQNIKEYINQQNPKLQVSIESTKPLKQTLKVKTLIEFLKFSYFGYKISEKNTLVLLGRSFEESLQEKISNFNKPIGQILLEAIKILHLSVDADVLRFVEISKEYDNIQSLLFGLKKLNEPSQNTQNLGIKVLTIHKSKGLEFKHTIVLDKLGRPNYQNDSFLFEYSHERLKKLFIRMKNREFVDEEYRIAKQKDKALNQIDLTNAMYVAFTRAEDSLIVIKKSKNSTLDFLDLADFKKGELIPSKQTRQTKKVKVFQAIQNFGFQDSKKTQKDTHHDLEATYFGLAFHYLLELTNDFNKPALSRAFIGVQNRYSDFVNTKKVLAKAYELIAHEKFKSLVSNGKIYKEKAILYNGERKQLDLLIERENKFIIIDYKTSNNIHDEHIKQVTTYKKALQNISTKTINAYLFYVKDSGVEVVTI